MSSDAADLAADATNEGEDTPKLDLEVKVDSTSSCGRHVTVTVSKDDVTRYVDDAFSELMPTANVPGFRSGRAPAKARGKSIQARNHRSGQRKDPDGFDDSGHHRIRIRCHQRT